ncbi:MAG: ABC-F family ATP-binding cassette domain-containing protein, partial [Actinobacteria bacterium]|nr:ABC-F family ATP-binding cassette domain-containing protein [Actinomycetota bacterium]
GKMMRVALARLLLSGPDLLRLDEPTNHLDVESVVWLEKFIADYDGAVLLISHDRDFIDAIATKVVEIDHLRLNSYTGDYESFVEQRELAIAQSRAADENRRRKVAQTQIFIDRFRYKASKAKQVQSRIKSLEKMSAITAAPTKRKTLRFAFPAPPRSGRVVLELKGVSFSYPGVDVYEELDIVIERNDKIALVGPNGAGKSTLLKLVAGALVPTAGDRTVGQHASVGYFAQHQVDALVATNRVIEELDEAIPDGVAVRSRDLLGRFMFSGDDVDKRVAVLSGGERTRLALAKLLVTKLNLLCLDEPTNHLDIQSRDTLEDALIEYAGALLLITHDRHLIRSVCTKIIEVIEGKVTLFDGDYDYYIERRAAEEAAAKMPIEASDPRPQVRKERSNEAETMLKGGPKTKEQRRAEAARRAESGDAKRRVQRLEDRVNEASEKVEELVKLLSDPAIYNSGEDVSELIQRYDQAKRRLEELEERWLNASSALEC